MRLFWALIRITSMVVATALSLEGLVAVDADADVVRLRRGDLNALSELIARYQNRLYRYLLRIVPQPGELVHNHSRRRVVRAARHQRRLLAVFECRR